MIPQYLVKQFIEDLYSMPWVYHFHWQNLVSQNQLFTNNNDSTVIKLMLEYFYKMLCFLSVGQKLQNTNMNNITVLS